MTHPARRSALPFVLVAASLAGCSGSSSGDSPTVSLAVTDAASEQLSTFVIGVESVELQGVVSGPVSILQQPIAVDFAALADLSRLLNVTAIPEDVYTGVEVVLLFDNDRVVINGEPTPATLLDASGNPLTGTLTLPIVFPVPLAVTTGNYVVELDLDLNQTTDVDTGGNQVYLEPTLLPRINRADPKEHAVGGDLRTVVLDRSLFRIGLEALPGDPTPVVQVAVGPGTVFQIDGACLLGAAGLSALDNLTAGSWVQAFGGMDASSSYFQAATVEAGSGSYNGGTDIVEGVITGRSGGAGTDTVLTVRGHSNNSTHTVFEFNLNYTINTSFVNTKVVRRGSATLYDTDDLNIGQRVRAFGLLDSLTNTLDVTTATDVVRLEPTWVSGIANAAPAGGEVDIDLVRVDLRDAAIFNWAEGGATFADPDAFILDDAYNLATGQGIANGTPVVALGFFSGVDDTGPDFVAGVLANRSLLPSVLLVRDRMNGLTIATATSSTSIDFTFTGTTAGLEKAVIDQGFVGQIDVTGPGVSIVPTPLNPLGLGFYLVHDRTLNTLSVHVTFSSFAQAVEDALMGGATLFNVGALGVYDAGTDTIPSAWAGVTVQ